MKWAEGDKGAFSAMKIGDTVLLNRATLKFDELNAQTTRMLGHLSSGQRIDRAADDAAGLGVAETQSSDLRVLRQGLRNLNDAISVVQTADAAVAEQTQLTKRLKELAVQAASESLGSDERGYVKSEMDTVVAEIGRIANTTSFNGVTLLNGRPQSGTTPTFSTTAAASRAATQTLRAETFTMTHMGSGAWSVVGSVTGGHANATSGTAYTSDAGSNTGTGGGGAGLRFTIASGTYGVGATLSATVSVSGGFTASLGATYSTSNANDDVRAHDLFDIDSDGDLDRAYATLEAGVGGKLVYQLNSAGTFGADVSVASDQLQWGRFADIDRDGDMDFVGTENNTNPDDFFTQTYSAGAFGAPARSRCATTGGCWSGEGARTTIRPRPNCRSCTTYLGWC